MPRVDELVVSLVIFLLSDASVTWCVCLFLCDHRMWCVAMHTIDDCEESNYARLAVFMWNSALVMVWRNVVWAAYQRSTIPFKWDPIVIGDVRRRLAVL